MDILLMLMLSIVVFVAILLMFPSGGKSANRRLAAIDSLTTDSIDSNSVRSQELNKPFLERVIKPLLASINKKDNSKNKSKKASNTELKKMIAQAGFPGGLTVQEFILVRKVVMVLFPLFFISMTMLIMPKMLLAGSLFGVGVGLLAPKIFLQRKIKQRLHDIQRQLPDVLDLLTVAVEAGLGFDAACEKVVEKMDGPIPDEFSLTLRHMQMGQARKDAFKSMAERVDHPDLNTFISAIIQADQLGVSIGQVLRIQSDQLRDKRRQRAEEEAAKAPVKMMIPLVFFIFPNVGIVIGAPALFQMLEAVSGME